mgnify:CR=1 FL=1
MRFTAILMLIFGIALSSLGLALDSNPITEENVVTSHRQFISDKFEYLTHEIGYQVAVEEIKSRPFTRLSGIPNFGLNDKEAIWMRVKIRRDVEGEDKWFLRMDTPLIKVLDVYIFDDDDKLLNKYRMGYGLGKKRPVNHHNYVIPLNLKNKEAQSIYMRVESNAALFFPVSISTKDAFEDDSFWVKMAFGFYYGIQVMIILFNFLMYLSLREKVYLFYVGFCVSLHLILVPAGFGFFGYLYAYNDIFEATKLVNISQIILNFFCLRFYGAVLSVEKYYPTLDRYLKYFTNFFLVTIIISPFLTPFFNLMIPAALLNVVVVIWICIISAISLMRGDPAARIIVASWFCLVLGAILYLLQVAGVTPVSESRYLLLLGSLLEALGLTVAIQAKISSIKDERERLVTQVGNLKNSLSLIAPSELIDKVINNSEILSQAPQKHTISVMFIDIVSFTQFITMDGSETALFDATKAVDDLKSTIRNHGGIIDKTLGDGILCFFGYLEKGDVRKSSALAALKCANSIQSMAADNLVNRTQQRFSFAFRIGINTDDIYVGNMGTVDRPDLTLSGVGVVLASRLEQSCEPFKVMLGSTTYKVAKDTLRAQGKLVPKLIMMKHQVELLEAFEYNPFWDSAEHLRKARAEFYDQLKLAMSEQRYDGDKIDWKLVIDDTECEIANFSKSGFGIISKLHWGRNVSLEVNIVSSSLLINQELEEKFINPFRVNIKWGTAAAYGNYRHGAVITSLNQRQKDILFNLLESTYNQAQR